ncbi:MAG: glycosidase [Deltaproteobacteria bacterium]|nr:glycosidase [Deltaproteobacteria bacterium]
MKAGDFFIGPFADYEENPILKPSDGFQSRGLYNPAVILEGESFYMLYRAETDDGLTGRIGLAVSRDGFRFTCRAEPIVEPGDDFDRGGCEDPRIVKLDELYCLTYVGNSGRYHVSNICVATSRDLLHWTKHGPVLSPREGSWDTGQIKAGAVVPERIGGRYVMYFMGEERPWAASIGIAYSEDLFHWYEPLERPVLSPRKGRFDCLGVEPGPAPVILPEGILLVYNGWGGDCLYRTGGALFSRDDPATVLQRSDEPLLSPARDYGEEFGTANHCVAEGLVRKGDKWLLYYGAADRVTCVATYQGGAAYAEEVH